MLWQTRLEKENRGSKGIKTCAVAGGRGGMDKGQDKKGVLNSQEKGTGEGISSSLRIKAMQSIKVLGSPEAQALGCEPGFQCW